MAKSEENALQVTQDPTFNLMQMVIEKGGDIANLEKLIDLQERVSREQARKSFYGAMSTFQSSLPVIEKTGKASYPTKNSQGQKTGQVEYDFAKLEDIAKAIRPLLLECCLSYRFEQKSESGRYKVICIVTHRDGHSEKTEMEAPADTSGKKNAIQQIASTISYLRRYTVTGALGIVVGGEDDDGIDSETAEAVYMDVVKFNEKFPAYEKLILDGKKTAQGLIEFLAKKGAILSPEQKDSIKRVEEAKQ